MEYQFLVTHPTANEIIKLSLPVSVCKAVFNSSSLNILLAEEWQNSDAQAETKLVLWKKSYFWREMLIHYGHRRLSAAENSLRRENSLCSVHLLMEEPWTGVFLAAVDAVGCLVQAERVGELLEETPSTFLFLSLKCGRISKPRSPWLAFLASLLNIAVAEATCPQTSPALHPWAAIHFCLCCQEAVGYLPLEN